MQALALGGEVDFAEGAVLPGGFVERDVGTGWVARDEAVFEPGTDDEVGGGGEG